MATNATNPSQLQPRTSSLQPPPPPPQQPQPQRSVTISRRQFGPATAKPQSSATTLVPQPTNDRPTPPPKSPQSNPVSTVSSNGNGNGDVPSPTGTPVQGVACPICNISVRNLAQLNYHLDTIHPEEPEDVKSAVSQFFKNAQKVFNPIAKNATTTLKNIPANSSELLRKIQDLDLDSAGPGNSLSGPPPPGTFQGWTDPRADATVTRRHWVKETDQDVCLQPYCEKSLGIRYGRVHCRSCGNIFCDTHTLFQLKLNAQARHDTSGLWCRVCEGCFVKAKKEEDELDAGGVLRNLTTPFTNARTKNVEKKHLEINRLEKRIEKLAQIHQQYDTGVSSTSAPSSPTPSISSTTSGTGTGSVRSKGGLLRSVTSTKGQQLKVFKRREHAADRRRPNAVMKYYGSLMRLKERIDAALPQFQEMLASLSQQTDMNQAHPDYKLAAKSRKELLDDFALFDSISKKIAKLPAHTQHQKQLYNNLYWWATQYLQTNMFPLSVIPKVFGTVEKDPKRQDTSSPGPSISSLDNDISPEAQAQMAVMEEQRRIVESYIEEATRKRKFDDVKSLKMSLQELDNEIAAIRAGR
ncbi:carboxypeptidase Y-deficient [Mortierella sp. GBA43]|nr:carboxypeptidase Y-deficient [Mortierella sp. GBA43]